MNKGNTYFDKLDKRPSIENINNIEPDKVCVWEREKVLNSRPYILNLEIKRKEDTERA